MNDQLWVVAAGVLGGILIGFGLSLMWVERLIVRASEAAVKKLMDAPVHRPSEPAPVTPQSPAIPNSRTMWSPK